LHDHFLKAVSVEPGLPLLPSFESIFPQLPEVGIGAQGICLPLGSVHALENPGKIPLELIVVQVGSYLGEDDIVRLQDRQGRA
jgi:Mannose-6-phosphate isomerase